VLRDGAVYVDVGSGTVLYTEPVGSGPVNETRTPAVRLVAVPLVRGSAPVLSTRELIRAAVADGAQSWAEVGRRAGVSRSRASSLGRSMGLALDRETRDAVLSVRVRASAYAFLVETAEREGRKLSDVHRDLLADGIRYRLESE